MTVPEALVRWPLQLTDTGLEGGLFDSASGDWSTLEPNLHDAVSSSKLC